MKDYEQIVRRKTASHAASCRGCDECMPKGTEVVSTFSWRNRGQNIYFCIPCAQIIGQLAGAA
jgi:hypothetical protein